MSELEDLISQILPIAQTTRRMLTGLSDEDFQQEFAEILGLLDISLGLFPAPEMPLGMGFHVIKGQGLMMVLAHKGVTPSLKYGGILCDTAEEAAAYEQTFGDGAVSH